MAEDRCAECGQDLRFCQGHALEGCGCFPVPIYCPKHDAVDDLLTALHDIEQAAEWGLPGEDARDRLGKISEIAQDAISKAAGSED